MRLIFQKRIPGMRRKHYGTAVEKKIEEALEKEVARYGVSKSFVIANALAYVFDIEVEDYTQAPSKPRKRG